MNKIEYAIKLYIKTFKDWRLEWYNATIGLLNMLLTFILLIGYLDSHGAVSSAELSELASALGNAYVFIFAMPLVAPAVYIVATKTARHFGYQPEQGELWPEVEL